MHHKATGTIKEGGELVLVVPVKESTETPILIQADKTARDHRSDLIYFKVRSHLLQAYMHSVLQHL